MVTTSEIIPFGKFASQITTEIMPFEIEPKKSPSGSISLDLEANLPPWRRHKLRASPVEPEQAAPAAALPPAGEAVRELQEVPADVRATVRELQQVSLEQGLMQVALEEGPKAMEKAGNSNEQVQEERTYPVDLLPPVPLPPLPKKNEVTQTQTLLSPQEKDTQGRAQLVRAQFWKTELCRFYPKCRKGDMCPFAHTDLEVKERPNLTKTSLCAAWSKNCCPFLASECKFAHGSSQLRKTGLFSSAYAAGEGRGKKGQLQKGGAAKAKKQQQQRLAQENSEIEPGTPSDTSGSGGTPVLPSTPTEFQPQFAVMPVQAPMMQANMMMQQVAVVFVPVQSPTCGMMMQASMPMQSPTYTKESLERALQQAMPECYED